MAPEIRIRGYHTDLYQHVNNARYLEFLEEGRWQILEKYMNLEEFMKKGFLFFVVNINISYRIPAVVNDIIVIKTGLSKIGNTSAVMKQKIINKKTGAVCVDADITFVIADLNGKPRKIEGELEKAIKRIPLLEG
jgi:thioesterase-3